MEIISVIADKQYGIDQVKYVLQELVKQDPAGPDDIVIIFGEPGHVASLFEVTELFRRSVYICKLNSPALEDAKVVSAIAGLNSKQTTFNTTYVTNNDIVEEAFPSSENANNVAHRIFKLLHTIGTMSTKGDLWEVDKILAVFKETVYEIHDSTISSNLLDITTCARNLIDLEKNYVLGNDNNELRITSTYTQYNQFVGTKLLDIKNNYDGYLRKYAFIIPCIDARIQLLELLKQLCEDARTGKHLPQLMFWHASYFLRLSIYYKSRRKYYAGILFILRALETALQGVALHHGSGGFGRQGKFELNGITCSGITEIFNYIKNMHLSAQERKNFDIADVITIRNNSIAGHGFAFLSEATYDYCYSKIKPVIICLVNKVVIEKNFWNALEDGNKTSIIKNINTNITSETINCLIEKIVK